MAAQDIFEEVGGGNAFIEGGAFEFENEVGREHGGIFAAVDGFGFVAGGISIFGADGANLGGDFGGGEEVADFRF